MAKGLGYGCPCAQTPARTGALCVTIPLYHKGKRSRVYETVCRQPNGAVTGWKSVSGRKSRTKVTARHRRALAKALRTGKLKVRSPRARRLRG